MPPDPFRDSVAIVTGAASGIGRALVENLLERDARAVVLADANEAGLKEVQGTLAARGAPVSAAHLDVTVFEDVVALVRETVVAHGRVDLVFNNAGVAPSGRFDDSDPGVWSRSIDINLKGVLYGTWAAYGAMAAQGSGHIVNTASLAGLVPSTGASIYAATKHAVVGFSTSLRAEAALRGVRVSVACPGFVDTGLGKTTVDQLGFAPDRLVDLAPTASITPDRCARAILGGVARNRAVIAVPAWAAIAARLYGIWPWLAHAVINPRIARRNERLRSDARGRDG